MRHYGILMCLLGVSPLVLAADGSSSNEAPSKAVTFIPHRLGKFRSEACGVGDFNRDGKLDIVAGPFIYLAPDWTPKKFHTLKGEVDEQGNGYFWDFMNAPLDVDGDGHLDVVTCSWFEKSSTWLQNPGGFDAEWTSSLVEENGNFECGDLVDIDGDGKPLEILPHVPRTVWYEVGTKPEGGRGLIAHVVSEETAPFGGGVGDVNGDGRPDILRPTAWYEAPEDPRRGAWKKHPLAVGHTEDGKADHTPQILVYDVNADGLADVLTSSAHGRGIFWYEQKKGVPDPTWSRHRIDDTWTQAHALTLADLDGDGDLDLVTGKRFRAHNGGDPEGDKPPRVHWYELRRDTKPEWIRHDISVEEGIGAGLSIPVVDLDGDGDLDIVVTGKWGGPVWFERVDGRPGSD